ncbi:RCC1 domain-containing protein, partial [Kibdelosporangium lantanae]
AASFAIGLAAAIDDKTSSPADQPTAPDPHQERVVPTSQTIVNNTGGAYVGAITTTGSVKVRQKVINYAKNNPRRFALIVFALIVVIGGGGYLGVNALIPSNQTSSIESPGSPGHTVLATATDSACGLRSDHTVQCWGEKGAYTPAEGQFTSISLVKGLGCGIRADRTVTCWAGPSAGARSNLSPNGQFQSAVGGCGVRLDGAIDCWIGHNEPPSGKFLSIALGQYGSWCALRDNKSVTCWDPAVPSMMDVPTGPFETVSLGGYHACGLRIDHTLACWGKNDEKQASPPTGQFTAVTTGEEHSCALRTDHTVVCWGRAKYGQTEPPGGAFIALGAGSGGEYSCGLRADGTTECWGSQGRYAPPAGKLATN